MKKITMVIMMIIITLTASAQKTIDNHISKLLKSYPKTPSREIIDKDIDTGKLLRSVAEYSFCDINPKKLTPLISALRDPKNGYYCYSQGNPNDASDWVYELRVSDNDPDYRTAYILQTRGNNAELHVIYSKMPYSEMYTNFCYTPGTYYTIVNKGTGAKLGVSFDYNVHVAIIR